MIVLLFNKHTQPVKTTNWLIADRCHFYRKGLADFIKCYQPDAYVTQIKLGREALNKLASAPQTIVIANIDLEMMDGIELFKTILHRDIKHHIFIFVTEIYWIESVYSRYANILLWHLKTAGVNYVSSKEELDEVTLNKIITSIPQGKAFVSESLYQAYHKATKENVFVCEKLKLLSLREEEYLLHFANHKSQSEIAAIMLIDSSTVNSYRFKVLKKIGLNNSNELKRFCSTYRLFNLNVYDKATPPYKNK